VIRPTVKRKGPDSVTRSSYFTLSTSNSSFASFISAFGEELVGRLEKAGIEIRRK
jgi:hypothetical protein